MSMDERLRDLMEFRPQPQAALNAPQVIARARRARARRTAAGVGAGALALAAGGVFVMRGETHAGVPTSPAGAAASHERSAQRSIALGRHFAIAPGLEAWLTDDGICTQGSDAFYGIAQGRVTPVNCAQYRVPGQIGTSPPGFAEIESDMNPNAQDWVYITGAYKGTNIPARIAVACYGVQTTATIVTSPHASRGVVFYAAVHYTPVAITTRPTGLADSPSLTATAYDASGRIIDSTRHFGPPADHG